MEYARGDNYVSSGEKYAVYIQPRPMKKNYILLTFLAICLSCFCSYSAYAQVLEIPGDLVVECGGSTDPTSTGLATASDGCEGDTPIISFSDDLSGLNGCSNTGTIIRTWTATDECGAVLEEVQEIQVVDTTPPTITTPSELNVYCGGSIMPEDIGFASASDACDATVAVDYTDATDGLGPCGGVIVRTWVSTDECGNEASVEQTLLIGNAPPVLTTPGDLTVECGGSLSPEALGFATASDGCSATINIAPSYTDDSSGLTGCGNTGVIVRTWTAVDECGVSSEETQTITVEDTTPPTILVCPPALDVACGDDVPLPNIEAVVAEDECSNVTVEFISDEAVEDGDVTTTTRIYAVSDECGNTTECVQTIVEDCTFIPQVGSFVWNDLDGDGIYDPCEPPMEGITVSLYDNQNQLVAQIMTNSEGRYVFGNLDPGTYYVVFDVPVNYVAATANAGSDDTVDSDINFYGVTPTFTLETPNLMNLDAGFVGYAVASVSNTVWADINNNGVFDGSDYGVPGATVTLNAAGGDGIFGSADDLELTTTTNEEGCFTFQNLAQLGDYILFVTPPPGFIVSELGDINSDTGTTPIYTIDNLNGDVDNPADLILIDLCANSSFNANAAILCSEDASSYSVRIQVSGGIGPFVLTNGNLSIVYNTDNFEIGPFDNLTPFEFYVTDAAGCAIFLDNDGEDVNCLVLPVQLLSFEGVAAESSNDLSWATASENNESFILERSSDGTNFEEIATLDARGGINQGAQYEFSDYDIDFGIYYYRLSEIANGTVNVVSDVIALTRTTHGSSILGVSPIPTDNTLNIEIGASEYNVAVKLEIFNIIGQSVKSEMVALTNATTIHSMDVSSLPTGVYVLSLNDGRHVENVEFIVAD